MKNLSDYSPAELSALGDELRGRYENFRSRNLKLDMTRGKQSPEQLDLAGPMLDLPGVTGYASPSGIDCRNYGGIQGLPETRELFAEYLQVRPEEVIVANNSSLTLMHDTVLRALTHGVPGGEGPWFNQKPIKFLCPVPGYDRHFSICEHFGIEMINVRLGDEGPDMKAVEELVASDPAIRGIWCVPKYSNPTGITYSDETVMRLASMRTAAPDFRIFWDNAYAVHHLTGTPDPLLNIMEPARAAGHPERPLIFASTSKISFAGAGLSVLAASEKNIKDALGHIAMQTIGWDKLNQLRHSLFFRDLNGILEHMKKHAALIKPKFDLVEEIFEREMGGRGIATWSKPRGGYFISLDTLEGCARETVTLAKDIGVQLTGAGATFPYRRDPHDCNIRIAPTFPSLEDIATAMEVVSVCVQLTTIKKLSTTGVGNS